MYEDIIVPLRGWMFIHNDDISKYRPLRHLIAVAAHNGYKIYLERHPVSADEKAIGVFCKVDGHTYRFGYLPSYKSYQWQNGTRDRLWHHLGTRRLYGHLEYSKNASNHNDFALVCLGDTQDVAEENHLIFEHVPAMLRMFDQDYGMEPIDNQEALEDFKKVLGEIGE